MSTNLFLTKGASIESMKKAMPKEASKETGFIINESTNSIEYNGNPKALKFVIPVMVAVVNSLDKSTGFTVVRTPKSYVDKNGNIKSTNITTVSYTDVSLAKILCENVNKLCKSNYEEYLKKSKK